MKHLLTVTELLKDRALESYRKLLAEEAQLKAERDQIDAMREAARSEAANFGAGRMVGADVLWQGWLSRKRSELNQAIIMARVKQAHGVTAAQYAFARDKAARDVAESTQRETKRRRMAEEEDRLEDLGRLMRFQAEDRGP
ncbi:hypothetical protein [Salipiger sp.]|uniref:hypothetical protein n=1 Tax=Salipiger sp. TaxID=2078585 RepID=UPI003A96CC86